MTFDRTPERLREREVLLALHPSGWCRTGPLQLDRNETELFYRAAGLAPPGTGVVSHHIPPGIQRMLVRMSDLPLAVFAADWTLLHSTPLWREGRAAAHRSLIKTVHNPLVGDVTLDCDVVTVPDSDIKLVVYSTTASGPDADKLDFLRVTAIRAPISPRE
jgi:hypothetical protein